MIDELSDYNIDIPIASFRPIVRNWAWGETISPDPDVGCALPDLRYIVYLALGFVVVAAALALWAVRKLRPW